MDHANFCNKLCKTVTELPFFVYSWPSCEVALRSSLEKYVSVNNDKKVKQFLKSINLILCVFNLLSTKLKSGEFYVKAVLPWYYNWTVMYMYDIINNAFCIGWRVTFKSIWEIYGRFWVRLWIVRWRKFLRILDSKTR